MNSLSNSILIISERFYPEDFGINELAHEWKKNGYKVYILTQTPSYPKGMIFDGYKNKLFQKEIWNDIVIYRVFTILGYQKSLLIKIINYIFFSFITTICSLFIFNKTKKIFIYQVGPLTQAIPGLFLKLLFNKKLYLWVLDLWPHTVYSYGFKKWKLFILLLNSFVKIIYRNCETIFISNHGFKDEILKYSSSSNIIYCPQWAPRINFKNVYKKKQFINSFNFTFAGNIGKFQNLENIVTAFSLTKLSSKFKLNIIGDGSNLKFLKKYVKKKKIKNIIFWGRRPLHEMPSWLFSSDVLLISLINKPNFNLTVPSKFQIYLALKKPIFSILNGETSNLVIKYNLGLFSHPDNLNEIQKTFVDFSKKSIDELKNYSLNSESLLNHKYDFKKTVKLFNKYIFK